MRARHRSCSQYKQFQYFTKYLRPGTELALTITASENKASRRPSEVGAAFKAARGGVLQHLDSWKTTPSRSRKLIILSAPGMYVPLGRTLI